jgi:DNA helicase HerA-like ATPase
MIRGKQNGVVEVMVKRDTYIGVVIDGVSIGEKETPSTKHAWVLAKRNDVVLGDFVKIVDKDRNIEFIGYISDMFSKSKFGLPLTTALNAVEEERAVSDIEQYSKDPILFIKITITKIYNMENKTFEDPIRPIIPGQSVYFLDEKEIMLKALGLNNPQIKSYGPIHIGSLYIRQDVPVKLESAFVFNHVGIWGMQGRGKSETATVLVEELAKLGWAVVLFDLHGEYSEIDQPKMVGDERLKVKRLILGSEHDDNSGESVKLNLPCLLEPDKAIDLLLDAVRIADDTNPLSGQGIDLLVKLYKAVVLGKAIKGKTSRGGIVTKTISPPSSWGNSRCPSGESASQLFFEGLIEKVDEVGEFLKYNDQTIDAVRRRLEILNKPELWGDGFNMKEIVLPGFVTLFDFSRYMSKTITEEGFDVPAKLIFAQFLKRLVEAKQKTHEIDVELPVAVIVDEAGSFFSPESKFWTRLGKNFIRQVRKLHNGLIVIAQSPKYLHPDIVGQIGTHIIFRITGNALKELKDHVDMEDAIFEDLKTLDRMVAYVFGDMTDYMPIKIRVREPRVKHKKFFGLFE